MQGTCTEQSPEYQLLAACKLLYVGLSPNQPVPCHGIAALNFVGA